MAGGVLTGEAPRRGPVVAVVGPTATGKSGLGVEFALRVGGQVVNADSMQLYRGMDVGTAKLDQAERRGVPHHLLDVWDVRRTASVADYQSMARGLVDRLLAEGIVPVLVGGSGLYLRAVLDDLRFPGTDPVVRARLEAALAAEGPAAVHARLAATDPASARRIGPHNGRRLVRALEVVELTGGPYTPDLPSYDDARYDVVHVGVDRDPAELDARLTERVERMWARGLVEEVRGLAASGLRDGVTAGRALGYAQALAQIDGRLSAAQARAETVQRTRRYVRRQRSWFRRDPRILWRHPDEVDLDGLVRTIGG